MVDERNSAQQGQTVRPNIRVADDGHLMPPMQLPDTISPTAAHESSTYDGDPNSNRSPGCETSSITDNAVVNNHVTVDSLDGNRILDLASEGIMMGRIYHDIVDEPPGMDSLLNNGLQTIQPVMRFFWMIHHG